ncbi:flagellar hook-length control protein FliK [Halomonas sp. 328]|uniref:flagellar hook-length control protein FliK n=1 Tax=Halomonas sp. 328 TaxID=2776704 RepID=UPI0018A6DB1D|nr:flagellar hook-length control protein FliK [Halomonas sp. 328]MBF8224419.1 flagellar hook-length control protein FliK [Halomonas sp. 328]
MSGITPILDTLLHQVLGKRVDHAPPRDLNEPVRPLNASDATRALHSDSRLDGRRPPIADLAPTAQRGEGRPAASQAAPAPAAGSFQTHFSPTARTIADLLIKFPAPPSAVRPAAPLMPQGESPTADSLAQRLEGSIRHSGLFHESHLARWYRGELPRAALAQEPQQWRTLSYRPAEGGQPPAPWRPTGAVLPLALSAARGAVPTPMAPGAGTVASPVATPGEPRPMMPGAASSASESARSQRLVEIQSLQPAKASGAVSSSAAPASRPAPLALPAAAQGEVAAQGEATERARELSRANEPIAESLQGVLRHQLELLVNPVVRWEGDVWSGIFMALVIQLPAGYEERARQEAEGEEGTDEAWASELTLVLPGLGEVAVQLRLVARRLNLTLDSGDASVVGRLEAGLPDLAGRLEALGFEARLAVRHRPDEERPEETRR